MSYPITTVKVTIRSLAANLPEYLVPLTAAMTYVYYDIVILTQKSLYFLHNGYMSSCEKKLNGYVNLENSWISKHKNS